MRGNWATLFLSMPIVYGAALAGALPDNPQGPDAVQAPDPLPRPTSVAIIDRSAIRDNWARYHDTIAGLGLTAAQQDRLLHLLVARAEAARDAQEASMNLGAIQVKDYWKSIYDSHMAVTSEIRELVGDAGVRALDRADAVAGLGRYLHGNAAADLAIAGVPLTHEQEVALAPIYADALILWGTDKLTSADDGSLPPEPPSGLSDADLKILDRAPSVLSPQQVVELRDSLKATRKQEKFMWELHAKWPRASLNGSAHVRWPTPAGSPRDPIADRPETDVQSPEEQLIRHRATLRNVWVNYNEIIRGLDLAPVIDAKVLNLLAARQEAGDDARVAAGSIGATDNTVNRSEVDAYNAISSELKDLIGDDGVRSLDRGQEFVSALVLVRTTFGVDMAIAGAPLKPDQETAMAHIYLDVMQAPRKSLYDRNGLLRVDPKTGLTETDQKLLERASDVLSPAELSALRHSLVESR